MCEFNIGDEIIITNTNGFDFFTVGDLGVLTNLDAANDWWGVFKGKEKCLGHNRKEDVQFCVFKEFEEQVNEFKAGDEIVITTGASDNSAPYIVGQLGKLTRLDDVGFWWADFGEDEDYCVGDNKATSIRFSVMEQPKPLEQATTELNQLKEKVKHLEYLGLIGSDDIRNHNVGASDYSEHVIQPWSIWLDYKLDPFRADIVKRILRDKDSDNPILDLQKIKHICDELIRQLCAENDQTNFHISSGSYVGDGKLGTRDVELTSPSDAAEFARHNP